MSERDLHTRCCIAGGGPAGIMLGYLLARAGIDVVILEKWPDFFRDFRGDTIHPSTMEVLAELGLLEDFLKLPHNEMTRMTFHAGNEEVTVADLSHLKVHCPFIAFMPQWDFLNFLSGRAKEYSNFHLLMATEAIDLIEENGGVVGVRAKDSTGEFNIHADLVVGADGRHSVIREKGGFAVKKLGVPIDVLWFRIAKTDMDDQQSLGYLGLGGGLIMLDRHDYWQCALIIKKNSFETVKAAGLETFRHSVAALARLSDSAFKEVDSWDKVKLLSVTVDHVEQWAKPGVLLIGDAAHAMSPIGGVGINYAIQDAVSAGNTLIPAFHKGRPEMEILKKIQARRSPPVLKMQRLQVLIQNHILSPFLERSNGSKKVVWFMRLFRFLPFIRRIPSRVIGIGFLPEHIETV
ncbi:MAG TPA: FAD-dependent oxidoreductase [Candidatus Paceibacterota bacterium]|nr:FAD-dependent oxidoreductase [Candidatus Paceibacterota bacterium]